MNWTSVDISLSGLARHYQNRDFTPSELVDYLLAKSERFADKNIWIRKLDRRELQPYLASLEKRAPEQLPLYGVPFAIKDNIDLAGIPTTAACPAFAYIPGKNAFVVEQLIRAGAIPLGKTNLDQFATGLVGTRSPFGVCKNAFDDHFISGGSSSGSAVAVALELASFSLGTDTAGSGRVPAAMNNIIGIKPTLGFLSTAGVVPACRSLDTVNIFSRSIADAGMLLDIAGKFDPDHPYSRPCRGGKTFNDIEPVRLVLGVPQARQLSFFSDSECETAFAQCVRQWKTLGSTVVEIDFQPFVDAAELLYQGPWITERYISIKDLLNSKPEVIDATVRQIIETARNKTADEVFSGIYRLKELKHAADRELAKVDVLLTPTVGTQYKIDQVLENPIALNNNLGYYTNYMNLLDYCAVAIPAGFTAKKLPFGITLVANAFEDRKLLAVAQQFDFS